MGPVKLKEKCTGLNNIVYFCQLLHHERSRGEGPEKLKLNKFTQ